MLGSVPERLRFAPTFVAQVASSFAGTLAPASIGGHGAQRPLPAEVGRRPRGRGPRRRAQRGGRHRDAHHAAGPLRRVGRHVGVRSIHLPDPQVLLYGAAVVVALAAIAFAIPAIRRILRDRLVPILERSIHGLFAVVRRPLNIAHAARRLGGRDHGLPGGDVLRGPGVRRRPVVREGGSDLPHRFARSRARRPRRAASARWRRR